MRTTVLAGAAAWLLGAAAATGGSLIAVNELAHGLLGPESQQLTGAAVNSDLANDAIEHPVTARPPRSAPPPPAAVHPGPRRSGPAASPARPATSSPAPAGTLLTSPVGSVLASCQAGRAYLRYWSPEQGYQADDVTRGPAAVASVTFTRPGGGMVLRVSCAGATPVARTFPVSGDSDDGGHDD